MQKEEKLERGGREGGREGGEKGRTLNPTQPPPPPPPYPCDSVWKERENKNVKNAVPQMLLRFFFYVQNMPQKEFCFPRKVL